MVKGNEMSGEGVDLSTFYWENQSPDREDVLTKKAIELD